LKIILKWLTIYIVFFSILNQKLFYIWMEMSVRIIISSAFWIYLKLLGSEWSQLVLIQEAETVSSFFSQLSTESNYLSIPN
jgi:hypothetical protein